MSAVQPIEDSNRYARAIEASKRIHWEIDDDVIRGRSLDVAQKFLPDGLSLVDELTFLTPQERRFLSQVQGRTYANIFGLVERFINAKILEISSDYWFGDQIALEALVRFSDEEIKHQQLFRRIEALAAESMPPGYAVVPDPNDVARFVLGKSTWSVLALTCHIEIFTQVHYKSSIEPIMSSRSSGRTCSSTIGRRNLSTQSWTSSSGAARTRSWTMPHAIAP